jgi:hypothetical protein
MIRVLQGKYTHDINYKLIQKHPRTEDSLGASPDECSPALVEQHLVYEIHRVNQREEEHEVRLEDIARNDQLSRLKG